jgi:hypothetical protein
MRILKDIAAYAAVSALMLGLIFALTSNVWGTP